MIVGPGSFISPDFDVADNVRIGANAQLTGRGTINDGVTIGHGTVIEGEAHIGAGSAIGHHVLITGRVRMGDANEIGHGCTIGGGPEHPEHLHSDGWIIINNRNVFRERCTVNMPTTEPETRIGSDNYLMHGVHIAHDCRVGNHVKFAPLVTIAGHVEIDDYAYLGLHVAVHQRMHVGRLCMVGMMSGVRRHLPPFATLVQTEFCKVNVKGLRLRGYSETEIEAIEAEYRLRNLTTSGLPEPSPCVSDIRQFLASHPADLTYMPNQGRQQNEWASIRPR